MTQHEELRRRILSGRSDANIGFAELRYSFCGWGLLSAFVEVITYSGSKVYENISIFNVMGDTPSHIKCAK